MLISIEVSKPTARVVDLPLFFLFLNDRTNFFDTSQFLRYKFWFWWPGQWLVSTKHEILSFYQMILYHIVVSMVEYPIANTNDEYSVFQSIHLQRFTSPFYQQSSRNTPENLSPSGHNSHSTGCSPSIFSGHGLFFQHYRHFFYALQASFYKDQRIIIFIIRCIL